MGEGSLYGLSPDKQEWIWPQNKMRYNLYLGSEAVESKLVELVTLPYSDTYPKGECSLPILIVKEYIEMTAF